MKSKNISIVFICLGDYHQFFKRFYESCEGKFLLGHSKKYYVISEANRKSFDKERVVFCKVDAPMEKSYKGGMKVDKTQVKLNKFKYINEHLNLIGDADYIYYFDADSYIKEEIKIEDVFNKEKPLTGVLHGWPQVRRGSGKKGKRFESNPKSAAYVDPEKYDTSEYYQSCFWGGETRIVNKMIEAVRSWIKKDAEIGHKNKYSICDEIYVNKFFLQNKNSLLSLGPEYANPGEGVAKKWGREKAKSRWGKVIISHECSAQNNTTRFLGDEKKKAKPVKAEEELEKINPKRTVGWLQTKNRPHATYTALNMFREHNPKAKLLVTSFGGVDLYDIAKEFGGSFEFLNESARMFPKKGREPLVSIPFFLKTLYIVCLRYENEADWLINLEDDVESFNTPKFAPKDGSLCGPFGPSFTPEMKKYLKKKAGDNFVGRYSGCGGSILNIKNYITAYEKLDKSEWKRYTDLDNRLNTSCDASITFVFQNAGYKICRWNEFTGYRNPDKKNYAFAHGSKKNYTNKVPTPNKRNIFIDCGGHNGQSIRKFKETEQYKEADWEIYSFEPNFSLIKDYADKHPEYNIKNEAVWTESGEKEFYIDEKDGDGSSLLIEKTSRDGTVENNLAHPLTVKAIDFSSWMLDNFRKEDQIIVKMDIEGAEYAVLQKMIKDGSLEYVNKLYVEWHHKKVGIDREVHQKVRNNVRQVCSKVFNL
jgi:FkbM family methyltransferase